MPIIPFYICLVLLSFGGGGVDAENEETVPLCRGCFKFSFVVILFSRICFFQNMLMVIRYSWISFLFGVQLDVLV